MMDRDKLSLTHLLGPSYAPLQPEMILAGESEVCAVAGMGGGKTWAACIAAFRHAIRFPEAKVLIARYTFPELIETTKFKFYQLIQDRGLREFFVKPVNFDYTERTNYARLRAPYHSEILFTNLDKDVTKLKNREFSFAFVDQVEEIDWPVYELLLKRTRWNKVPGSSRQVMSAANDEGDNWIRRRFLTYENPHGAPSPLATRRLVRGSSLQNPYLDAHARAQLLLLPPELQARWVFATMDAGTSRLLPPLQAVPPVEIPPHWPRWVGIDPARSTGVTCALVLTANPDGVSHGPIRPGAPHFMAEYWQEGREAEDHVEGIFRLTDPYPPRARVMDHSAWQSQLRSRRLGQVSVADLYIRAGLPVAPSSGDAWARVLLYLSAARRGLTVSEVCQNLLRQGPEYRIKGQRGAFGPIKIDRAQTFHAVDAGGYALSCLPSVVNPVVPRPQETVSFEIGPDVDPGSRRHWDAWRRSGPRPSRVTAGIDEEEFHRDEVGIEADWSRFPEREEGW